MLNENVFLILSETLLYLNCIAWADIRNIVTAGCSIVCTFQ